MEEVVEPGRERVGECVGEVEYVLEVVVKGVVKWAKGGGGLGWECEGTREERGVERWAGQGWRGGE